MKGSDQWRTVVQSSLTAGQSRVQTGFWEHSPVHVHPGTETGITEDFPGFHCQTLSALMQQRPLLTPWAFQDIKSEIHHVSKVTQKTSQMVQLDR